MRLVRPKNYPFQRPKPSVRESPRKQRAGMSSKEARLNAENVERINHYRGWEHFEKTLPVELGGHPELQAIHLGRNRTTHILSCAKCGVHPTKVWNFLISKQESAGGFHPDQNDFPSVNSLRSAAVHFKRMPGLVLKIDPAKYRAAMGTRLLANNDTPFANLTENQSFQPSMIAQHTSTLLLTQSRAVQDNENPTENGSPQSSSLSRGVINSNYPPPAAGATGCSASGRAATSAHPTPEPAVDGQSQDMSTSVAPSDASKICRHFEDIQKSYKSIAEIVKKKRQRTNRTLENRKAECIRFNGKFKQLLQQELAAWDVYQEHVDRDGAETQQADLAAYMAQVSEMESINKAIEVQTEEQKKRRRLCLEEFEETTENSPSRRKKIDKIPFTPEEPSMHNASEGLPVSGAAQVSTDLPPQAPSRPALSTRTSEYPAHPYGRNQPTKEIRGGHSHDSPTAAPPSETFSTRRESVSTPRRSSASLSIGEPEALESSKYPRH